MSPGRDDERDQRQDARDRDQRQDQRDQRQDQRQAGRAGYQTDEVEGVEDEDNSGTNKFEAREREIAESTMGEDGPPIESINEPPGSDVTPEEPTEEAYSGQFEEIERQRQAQDQQQGGGYAHDGQEEAAARSQSGNEQDEQRTGRRQPVRQPVRQR